jgi:murein DD-endopeptidase MepM/ murein hydrolase activator NlpD
MSQEIKPHKRIYRKLRNKYRLVVMNDETLEERTSFRLSPMNVFVSVGIIFIILITATIYLIAFTGLREYIPGYADPGMKRKVFNLNQKADSLQRVLDARETYIENFKNIMDGKVEGKPGSKPGATNQAKYDTLRNLPKSREDSLFRLEMERQDKETMKGSSEKTGIGSFFFFSPVKGTVTSAFNVREKHYGIDIVAADNEAIKAASDGVVVLSNFTTETGYVIAIQHSNNLLTMYKHNSSLLKKTGEHVKAGDVIAIIGNTGEHTTGPHLHFELWYNGTPVDPQKYVTF